MASMCSLAMMAVVTAVGCGAPGARADTPMVLGAAGDSLTTEYFEQTFSYAKGWTELLVQHRGVNMGPTAAQSGLAAWPGLRGAGYQNNYARPGATTDALVNEGSPWALADAAATRGVTHVVVCASGNDLAIWNNFVYYNFYYSAWSPRRVSAYVDSSVGNVREAVQVLHDAGIRVVLANMPDFGVMPANQEHFADIQGRLRVTAVVRKINDGLEDVAREFRIPLVDLFALDEAVLGPVENVSPRIGVGGLDIALQATDADGTHQRRGFVADGVHLGTVMQSIWANAIIAGLNVGYKTNLAEFSDTEILSFIGEVSTVNGQLGSEIGPFQQYTRSYVCAADFNADGAATPLDVFDYIRAWFNGDWTASFGHPGSPTTSDVFDFLSEWLTGC